MSERSRSDELAALTTIASQVNCTQDLSEILGNALETTLSVVGESAGEIFLADEDSGQLRLFTHRGVSTSFVTKESAIGQDECICGLAFTSQLPVIATDMEAHPVRSRTTCMREGFRSCIRLPISARGTVLGLLNIQSREHREFSAADLDLLTAIGNQIGIAIANARLIEDADQRRATLDSVMNSLVDGLVLADRRGRIAYINPCAAQILELPTHALLGRPLATLEEEITARVAQPDQVAGQLRTALSEVENTPTVEFKQGESDARTLQVRAFPIHDASGGYLGLGLLVRDITRERELDEMKSQLLSTVSHELRTPLASIKGFATTLLREDVAWDEDSRREFLSIIDRESDRLAELISNLLDMSRVEAGTLRVEPEEIDLGLLITETADEFQRMTRSHHIQTRLPRQGRLVLADPRRARQVLRNLVENAVKYSPNGGQIAITAQQLDTHMQTSVADEGIGIEPAQLSRIFDRFYQVDSASTRKVGGSGLGLSICKAIIEAHGGQIWAESEPGVGSTFTFTVPLAHEERAPHKE
ncbi:MAG: ATP-binding protein [Anaerolineae bacterium]